MNKRMEAYWQARKAVSDMVNRNEREYTVNMLKELKAYVDMRLSQESAFNERDNVENKRF